MKKQKTEQNASQATHSCTYSTFNVCYQTVETAIEGSVKLDIFLLMHSITGLKLEAYHAFFGSWVNLHIWLLSRSWWPPLQGLSQFEKRCWCFSSEAQSPPTERQDWVWVTSDKETERWVVDYLFLGFHVKSVEVMFPAMLSLLLIRKD